MVIAVFFLSNGQCAVCDTQLEHGNTILDSKPKSNSVGIYTNFDTRLLPMVFHNGDRWNSKGSTSLISENSVDIIHIATVFANITSEGVFMIAVHNNSLLNAKYSVFVLAHENITVNGVRMNVGTIQEWTAPFPALLGITHNGSYYQIRLRQVSSLDDIEDTDRPANLTAEYNAVDMAYTVVAGIPATLASLAFWVVVMVLMKSQKIQEGLPDGI